MTRNSGNSGMPPSDDDLPGKTPPAPKPKRGNGVASHQLIDTPAFTATVTQYDEHTVACRCGLVHAAAPPPGTSHTTQ